MSGRVARPARHLTASSPRLARLESSGTRPERRRSDRSRKCAVRLEHRAGRRRADLDLSAPVAAAGSATSAAERSGGRRTPRRTLRPASDGDLTLLDRVINETLRILPPERVHGADDNATGRARRRRASQRSVRSCCVRSSHTAIPNTFRSRDRFTPDRWSGYRAFSVRLLSVRRRRPLLRRTRAGAIGDPGGGLTASLPDTISSSRATRRWTGVFTSSSCPARIRCLRSSLLPAHLQSDAGRLGGPVAAMLQLDI